MGPESHVFLREATPYGDDLVGLAGVGVQQMLEERLAGAGNILRRNGNEVVVHDRASLAGAITANTTKGATGAPWAANRTDVLILLALFLLHVLLQLAFFLQRDQIIEQRILRRGIEALDGSVGPQGRSEEHT